MRRQLEPKLLRVVFLDFAKRGKLVLDHLGPGGSRLAQSVANVMRHRMGWGIDWVSSGGSDFNRDLGFLYTEEELKPFLEGEIPLTVEQNARMCATDVVGYVSAGPGLSGYALSDGIVYRTYVSTARGLEPATAYHALLDRTPKGRDESDTRPLWVRRHDEYETS
jgi:predicted dithiol-disulfide oxidoreductase (DUF899 family)